MTESNSKSRIRAGTPEFWKAAIALCLGSFTTFSLLHSPQPILPQLADEFHLTPSQASLSMSAGTMGMAFSLIPFAMLADRFGRERLMKIGVFGAAFFSLISAIAPDYVFLLISRACTGCFAACVPASAVAFLTDEIEIDARGKAVGIYIAGNALGGMFGRIVSALFTDWLGWRWSLAILGAAGLIGAICFLRLLPRPHFFTPSDLKWRLVFRDIKQVYSDKQLPWLFTAAFLLMGSFIAMYNYLGFRLSAAPYSLGPSVVGCVFLLYSIGSVSSAKAGELADKIGHQRVAMIFSGCMAIGILITLFEPLAIVALGLAIFTVGYFGVFSVGNAWVGHLAGQRKAMVSALFFSSCYVGSSALGTLVGIPWSEAGWIGVVSTLMVCLISIMLIIYRLRNRGRDEVLS